MHNEMIAKVPLHGGFVGYASRQQRRELKEKKKRAIGHWRGESQTTSEHLSFIITIHGSNKRKVKMKHQTHLSKSLWLLPTETYAGDPEKCSRMDDSPDDPGISNPWDSSDARGASGGGPSRGA